MATFMCNITGKTARVVIWLLMLVLVFQRVYPFILSNSLNLWILMKRPKFIYVVLNFIIVSILISSSSSSSSFTPCITNFFLKLHEKAKLQNLLSLLHDNNHNNNNNYDGCYNNQRVVDPCDDDTWWLFTPLDHEQPIIAEEETRKEAAVEEEEIEEEDSLDATWKAIMEAKGKESGPQLKKSDTWSYGDGGVDKRRKERVGLRKYRVGGELKKWQSSRTRVEGKENLHGAEGGGGGGWRRMEGALTFHDELKKRADAFIARFSQDIHLQRLESDQRFLDMINRGL